MDTRFYLLSPEDPESAFTIPELTLQPEDDYPWHAGFSRLCAGEYWVRPCKNGSVVCPYQHKPAHGHLILASEDGHYIPSTPIQSREMLARMLDLLVELGTLTQGRAYAARVVLKEDTKHLAEKLTRTEENLLLIGEVKDDLRNTWWVW
jgi:hypothetical protein